MRIGIDFSNRRTREITLDMRRVRHVVDIDDELATIAQRAIRTLKQNTPGKKLPSAWDFRVTRPRGGVEVDIFNPRADNMRPGALEAIESGSRPHMILPTHAKALAFRSSSGDRVIVKSVPMHPGTKPYHPIRSASLDVKAGFDALRSKIQRRLRAINR